MDMPARLIAQTYDHVPYESKPFPQSHPARLAARARLFGLTPPDVTASRVLELGCAAGGNLIPMAAACPNASFAGVDVSGAQVAAGRARIARLGLANIELRQQSIADLTQRDGPFDFIICHGVYSWVPEQVRAAILRVAHDLLSERGVAYVSYNVFPGWRLRGVLREAMLFHIGGELDPARKIALARDYLAKLAEITDAASPYGQMLRQEARALAGMGDYYLFHEFLEIDNEPCYVTDFLVRVRNARLEYLTDANLNVTIAESFGEATGKLLRDLSGNTLDRMEQYIDFLTGRTFRQSLLVRGTQAASIQRQLSRDRMAGLFASARTAAAPGVEGATVFTDANGRSLTTRSANVCAALELLTAAYPQSRTPEDLARMAADSVQGDAGAAAADIRDALFKMVLIGMADISTEASAAADAVAVKPKATLLARTDAQDGCAWTTNGRHEVVPLTIVMQVLLPLLDGTNDRATLEDALARAVADGRTILQRAGQTLTEPGELKAAGVEHVEAALTQLATAGLLVDA